MNDLMLSRLIASARPDDLAACSFRNYHAEGLDYLCLLRNPRLTVKVYFFNDGLKTTETKGRGAADAGSSAPWLVWPHNHRYTFEHRTLTGHIVNARYSLDLGAGFAVYAYDSHTRRPSRIGVAGLRCKSKDTGHEFTMTDTDELHTLLIESPTAIAAQVQYHDSGNDQTMLVAPYHERVVCGDNAALYERPNSDEVRSWLKRVVEVWR